MQHGYVRENVQYVRIRVRTYVVHIHTFACCSTPKQTSNYVKIDAHAHGNRRPDERTHGRTDGQTDRRANAAQKADSVVATDRYTDQTVYQSIPTSRACMCAGMLSTTAQPNTNTTVHSAVST